MFENVVMPHCIYLNNNIHKKCFFTGPMLFSTDTKCCSKHSILFFCSLEHTYLLKKLEVRMHQVIPCGILL